MIAATVDHQVVFPRSIGAYVYYARGTYRGAVQAFGRPSAQQTVSPVACRVSWNTKGVQLYFRSPARPCKAGNLATASFAEATILSRAWNVDRGVRVGDSLAAVKRLYPAAEQSMYSKSRWHLRRTHVVVPKTHARVYAGLDAIMRRGRVLRFDIAYQF